MSIQLPDGTVRSSNYSRGVTEPGERGCVQWGGVFVPPHHREHFTAWFTDWSECDGVIVPVYTGEVERRVLDARPHESIRQLYGTRDR